MSVQFGRITNDESSRGDFTHYAVFTYEDIANNATSANQVAIATIPAGGGLQTAYVYEETALAGAADITLDVGTTSGDPDEFIDALDVDAMTAPVSNTGDLFDAGTATSTSGLTQIVGTSNSAQSVLVEWNGTVASLTAGRVVILLKIVEPGRFVY